MSNLASVSFPNGEWSSIECGGVLAMFNGSERPLKYEPESKSVKKLGLVNPVYEMSASDYEASGLSSMLGNYVLCYVEVDENANQGNGLVSGPITIDPSTNDLYEGMTFNVKGGKGITLDFSSCPLTNPTATHRWIYISLVDGVWPVLGRVISLPVSTTTYNITQFAGTQRPDFTNYPLDQNRKAPPNKSYPMKMKRRLITWGSNPLDTVLTLTIGSSAAYYCSGDHLDSGVVGMIVYPEGESRGYEVHSFQEDASPDLTLIRLDSQFVGTEASETTSNIDCKICARSGAVAWSEPDDYENVPAANIRFVELSAADPETGCGTVNGRGLLFTVRKTFSLDFNTTPAVGAGQVAELSTAIGCLSHRTVQDIGGTLVWLSEAGIAMSSGGQPQIVSDEIASEFDDIVKDTTGRVRQAFAINWRSKQRYLLFVPRAGDLVGCSSAIVMDYRQIPGEPRFRFTTYTFDKEFTCGTEERHSVSTTNADGTTSTSYDNYPILGDKDGYVWTFGTGEMDGPPSGTVTGTIASGASSPNYLTCTGAAFYTTGLGLAGIPMVVRRTSDGTEQTKIIESNSADTVYPAADWDWLPVAGDTFRIGQIDAYYETPWSALGGDFGIKKLHSLILTHGIESAGTLDINVYTDFSATALSLAAEGSTFDLASADGRGCRKLSGRKCWYSKVRLGNKNPNEPFTLKAATLVTQAGPDEPR